MTKEEKRKKGIIKVFNFDKKCNCVNPSLFTKRVNSKDHMICSTCNCVNKNSVEDLYGVAV
jgi:hypothetical protein